MTTWNDELDTAEEWPEGSFDLRLAAAIERRGLGLQRLSAHLDRRAISCSASTLSLWRAGRTRPRRAEGLRAVEALEDILDTPAGYLVRAEHVPVVGSSEWWAIGSRPEEVLMHGEEYSAALEEFGMPDANAINRLAALDTVRVDANRSWVGSHCTYVIQARQDGVDRMVSSCYSFLFPVDSRFLRISEPRAGARLGRRRVSRESGQVISEFIFDAPLEKGEITVIEYDTIPVDGPEPAIANHMCHELRSNNPIGSLNITVDFDEAALPTHAEQEIGNHLSRPEIATTSTAESILQGHRAVAAANDLSEGAGLRLTWHWEDT